MLIGWIWRLELINNCHVQVLFESIHAVLTMFFVLTKIIRSKPEVTGRRKSTMIGK